MDDIISRQTELHEGFNKRALEQYTEILLDTPIPEFSVSKEPNGICISILVGDVRPNSTVGSTIKPEVKVSSLKVPNFVHDFTFGHLSSTTDKPFISEFPSVNDGFNFMSPDLILTTTSGSIYVLEFTTFRGGEEGARQAAITKIGKYEVACENRSSGHRLCLSVISVHRHGVWSNLQLEEEDVNELVFRFRLAVSIFEEIKIVLPEVSAIDEDLTKSEREVLGIASSSTMDWDITETTFPYFKKEMFENFSQEPNIEYISSIITKCLEESQQEIYGSSYYSVESKSERFLLNYKDCDRKLKAYINSYNEMNDIRDRYDSKATIQIPPWVTREGEDGKGLGILSGLNVEGDNVMSIIWQKVCISASLGDIDRMEDNPEEELKIAMGGLKDRPDERNKYHRVRIQTNDNEKRFLASLGVGGKNFKDDPIVQKQRARSKLAFGIDHDISALSSFILKDDIKIFQYQPDVYQPLSADKRLRLEAMSIHQPTLFFRTGGNEMIKNHYEILGSPLGSWTQMVSIIGAELSASVKQHVKTDCFVIKRLLNSGIFLLIKPTSSKSHIFVSFAVLKSLVVGSLCDIGVFKSYYDSGDLLITDFVSFKQSKLTNLCKCSPLYEAALCFWVECFGGSPWMISESLNDDCLRESRIMTKLSLLTLLEDKAKTEELQTMMRYVVMEGFVSEPEIPKPQKMIGKLPKILRSELQVYFLSRMRDSMSRISKGPFQLRKKDGMISWSGLFNPLTGNSITELQGLISSCYNGYFKNKEEETEPSALSEMYKKIIELEHLKPESDKYLGWDDPIKPQMHEFSRSYLKEACRHGKSLLKRLYGQNVMDQIDSQITRDISSLTLERLATLKATSQFTEDWYVYKDVKDKNYTRDKLIVKMSEFASNGKTLAIEMFEDCMRKIEMRGSMHICLFKKQQHGGLREIYVMGAEERIVQSLVESIAKSIGKFFPSDTLCNPANKVKIPESHAGRARKHCGGPVWTCATSDDARKWNQGHFVTKFALMLCEFTHPRWWPIIIRGCSMFTNKFMMMNLNYISILDGHSELNIRDEFVNTLFEAYHGQIEVPWIKKGRTYLQTTTGMMQGILHFTSSLLHTLHQEYTRSLSFRVISMKVGQDAGSRVVCDMMQGSDDSSMLLSFPSSDQSQFLKFKVAVAICFRLKKKLGEYLAIYPSEKSTPNTDFVMEYNSEFFFHSQHVRPTVRWVAACCSLPEVETLVARQEEASNLLTSVTEGGGSFSLAAMIQHSQCTLHYLLMGMGVSSLFSEFCKAILKWKDPGLGFFLFDNPFAAGLGGFRFNLFKAITCTDLMRIYAYFMRRVKGLDHPEDIPETCSVSPGGAIILSSSLKWGSRKKFQKLRSRLNIPEDWVELINQNPEVLYRAPRTGDEILLRIAEKVHSPGVVSSLSTGNAVSKVMASSVYFLSATIFQDAGKPEFSFLEDSKYSLLQKMAAYNGLNGVDDLEPEDIIFLFPNIEELESLDSLIYDRGEIQIINRSSRREATQSRVTVFDEVRTMRTSPEKLVSDKWFGTQKSKVGRTTFQSEWDKLTKVVRWLRETPSETLNLSPLHNQIQIRNFFARMEGKQRTVRITGAPVKKRSGVSKLAMVIRDNFTKIGFLKEIEDLSGMSRGLLSESLKHIMYCVLQGPYTDEAKLVKCYQVLNKSPLLVLKPSDGGSKTNKLAILQKYANDCKDVITSLEELGAGVLGGFIKTQLSKLVDGQVHYYGLGVWRGLMDGVQVQIEVDNKIGQPTEMTSVSLFGTSSPWEVSQNIRSWAEDMDVKNNTDISSKVKHGKFWIHNFRIFGASKPFGCPVYILNAPMLDLRSLKESEVKMKVRRSTINLYTRTVSGRDLHILSYTASDTDLSPMSLRNSKSEEIENIMTVFSKEPSFSWIHCKPLDIKFLEPMLDVCEGIRSIPTIDPCRLLNILKTCCESSLRIKVGTIFSYTPSSSEMTQVDLDAVMDLMLDDIESDLFGGIVESLDQDISGPYDIEEFDTSDVYLFGPAHYKEVSNLAMVSHPLMDKFVEILVDGMGRQALRRSLEHGVCQSRFKSHVSILFRALGRDPRSLRIEEIFDDMDSSPVVDDMLG
ncbi:RNA-dependent RNA polymerase [Mona Grita virus]|uniref:RNA-directed RNA polymerase L n=1 Tax=Mona Grita virus TaxID=2559111 RepID=A0A482K9V9_9VIRU|nr:RNA-dependent RNA polymerase [Mona Grita virus]QBQ01754.1 RNA-dependent RNA polymerase [Mona Grita virus]